MCNDIASPPIRREDRQMFGEHYPEHTGFIDAVHAAITNSLHPHFAVLPALTVMYDHHRRGQYGLLHEFEAVRLPLSIVGKSNTRWRTETVRNLHDAFLPFAMAGRNCDLLDEVMTAHGVTLFRDCSCGIVMIDTNRANEYRNSTIRRHLNHYRSSLDRMGAPVQEVCCLNHITEPTMDITDGEKSMFSALGRFLKMIRDRRGWFDPTIFASGEDLMESKRALFALAGVSLENPVALPA